MVFHRKFPEIHISASYISKLYKKFGVSKKKIVIKKRHTASKLSKIGTLYNELKRRFARAEEEHKRVLFIDECLFSSKALTAQAYSNKKANVELNQKLLYSKPIALVAAVSREKGL